jgi:Peptidase propeptide and YPEB domain
MNRVTQFLAILTWTAAATALAATVPCSIHPPKGATKAELAKLVKVSRTDAEAAAKASFKNPADATVAESELEAEHGCLIWSFDFKVKGAGGVQEVQVDAGNGKVLSSVHESPGKEAAEKDADHATPPTRRR